MTFGDSIGPGGRGSELRAAVPQLAGFAACQASHGTRRCAFLFEMLEKRFADVFFHCDQIIRGIYHPFLAEWKAAFPRSLLVLRAEDLLGREREAAHAQVYSFLGLPPPSGTSSAQQPQSYAETHRASLQEGSPKAAPMRTETRAKLSAFYAPYNAQLAGLLGEPAFRWE